MKIKHYAGMPAKSQTEVNWKYINKQDRNTGQCSVEYLLPGCVMFWVLSEERKKGLKVPRPTLHSLSVQIRSPDNMTRVKYNEYYPSKNDFNSFMYNHERTNKV